MGCENGGKLCGGIYSEYPAQICIHSCPERYDERVWGDYSEIHPHRDGWKLDFADNAHDAPFLLLDEPTSNLDSLNEAVILKSLREGQDGKTALLVSHRQSTMRITDAVYSIESLSRTGGRVS